MPPGHQRYCCVCKNFSGKIIDGVRISMHRFPADKGKRRIWISRCKNARSNFKFVNSDQTRLCSQHFVGKEGPTKTNPLPSIFPKPDGNDKLYKLSFHDYGGCITSCGGIAHKAEQIEPVMISVSTQTDEISDEKHVAFTQTISSETCSVGIQVNKPDLTFEDIENNDEKLMIIPEFSEKVLYERKRKVLNQILGLPPDLLDSYEVIIC
ncbi:hypothetical protein KUTeg_011744, partial [Tegillarca granosa]